MRSFIVLCTLLLAVSALPYLNRHSSPKYRRQGAKKIPGGILFIFRTKMTASAGCRAIYFGFFYDLTMYGVRESIPVEADQARHANTILHVPHKDTCLHVCLDDRPLSELKESAADGFKLTSWGRSKRKNMASRQERTRGWFKTICPAGYYAKIHKRFSKRRFDRNEVREPGWEFVQTCTCVPKPVDEIKNPYDVYKTQEEHAAYLLRVRYAEYVIRQRREELRGRHENLPAAPFTPDDRITDDGLLKEAADEEEEVTSGLSNKHKVSGLSDVSLSGLSDIQEDSGFSSWLEAVMAVAQYEEAEVNSAVTHIEATDGAPDIAFLQWAQRRPRSTHNAMGRQQLDFFDFADLGDLDLDAFTPTVLPDPENPGEYEIEDTGSMEDESLVESPPETAYFLTLQTAPWLVDPSFIPIVLGNRTPGKRKASSLAWSCSSFHASHKRYRDGI